MKRTIIRLILFAGIFLLYDKLFLIIANHSADAEIDKRLEYVVQGRVNSDIIIVGSSRGARGIIAGQIEEKTGLQTYNLCYPGSNIEFHEFIVNTLFSFNETPKLIMLVVDDDTEFKYTNNVTFREDRLYPLIKYPVIYRELARIDNGNQFFSTMLVQYRLNKYNFDLRKKTFTPLDTIMECGSMPITWQSTTDDPYLNRNEREYKTDDEVKSYISAYHDIIELCLKNNVDLQIIMPPLNRKHSSSFENRVRELTHEDVGIYVYNTKNSIYRDADYFHNGGHLIRKGAEIFTDELIQYIEEQLNMGINH